MTMYHFLPPEDWQQFQRLVLDIFKIKWNNPNAQEFGDLGQRQDGVDIYGKKQSNQKYEGVQCKETKKVISKKLIKAEYEKAKKFEEPALFALLLCYN